MHVLWNGQWTSVPHTQINLFFWQAKQNCQQNKMASLLSNLFAVVNTGVEFQALFVVPIVLAAAYAEGLFHLFLYLLVDNLLIYPVFESNVQHRIFSIVTPSTNSAASTSTSAPANSSSKRNNKTPVLGHYTASKASLICFSILKNWIIQPFFCYNAYRLFHNGYHMQNWRDRYWISPLRFAKWSAMWDCLKVRYTKIFERNATWTNKG